MASKDMTIILGGKVLPKYSRLTRRIIPNEADNITLGGNLFTDFRNYRRSWVISWDKLKASDFDIINEIYLAQFENNSYTTVQIDEYSIYAAVKVGINDQNIKWNGEIYENFTITLNEQYAIS